MMLIIENLTPCFFLFVLVKMCRGVCVYILPYSTLEKVGIAAANVRRRQQAFPRLLIPVIAWSRFGLTLMIFVGSNLD